MAYVTSSSTLAQVYNAIDDNADYDVEDSVTKAKQYIVALRILMTRLPTESRQSGRSVREEHNRLEEMMKTAQDWLRVNDSNTTLANTGQVRYLDISQGFR